MLDLTIPPIPIADNHLDSEEEVEDNTGLYLSSSP